MSPRALAVVFVLCASSAHAAPPRPVDRYNEGIAKKKVGDLAGAEASFRACIDLDAKYARCHFSLGVLLKTKGDLGGAVDHFRKAIEAQPSWGQAHLSLAFALIKQGQGEAARPELEAALSDAKLETDDKAEAHNALGVLHRQAKRWQDAVASFDQAIALKPDDANYHRHKALSLEQLDDIPGMEREARKATELAPNDTQAWTTLAIAEAHLKRPDDALISWRRATEADSKNARAWYGRGEAAETIGNKTEAKDSFEKYLALVPPNETQDVRERLKKLD